MAFPKTTQRIAYLGIAAVLAFIVTTGAMTPAAFAQNTQTPSGLRQISVNGEAEIYATPDMARISIGVSNQDKTAAGALDLSSEAMQNIMARLSAFEIEPRHVQTSNLQVHPTYSSMSSSSGRQIDGYNASLTVSVQVMDITKVGLILDAVVSDGANQLHGLQFDLRNRQPLMDQARQAAVANGLARAELYAQAAQVNLGKLLHLSENGGAPVGPSPMMMRAESFAADTVPMAEGELVIRAEISMIYEIE